MLKLSERAELLRISYYPAIAATLKYQALGFRGVSRINAGNIHVDIVWTDDDAYIVIPGTNEPGDLLTMACGSMQRLSEYPEGSVHAGMYSKALEIDLKFSDIFYKLCPQSKRIHICGHSLGGGIAEILAYTLSWRISSVATFGAVRPGDEEFSGAAFEAFKGAGLECDRVVNGSDPVPRLFPSIMGYWHPHSRVMHLNVEGPLKLAAVLLREGHVYWEAVRHFTPRPFAAWHQSIKDHRISSYRTRLAQAEMMSENMAVVGQLTREK